MTRVLVTGASGLLGANLILEAHRAGHTVVANSRSRPIHHAEISWRPADLTDPGAVADLMDAAEPDWVVNCAAATDVDRCEGDREWAFGLNRDAAGYVAAAALKRRARLVHVSTDAVFDGEGGPYSESDLASPRNVYGESKLAGEIAVADVHPGAAIVRTNFYGWSPPGRISLAEWFLVGLNNNGRVNGFEDVCVSPLLANDLAGLMLDLLTAGAGGVFHLGSRNCVSKYEFGLKLAELYGLDGSSIQPVTVESVGLIAPRPKRLCLEVQKVERELQVELPSLERGLDRMEALDRSGYRMQVAELIGRPRKVPG